ncbi:hypothetical protein LC653_04945 [Nostoc sp. CHAB 5784]|uniref:hypothetical protein n=1 Tax=Nostoc mirabile TaxID=2907820 RepID=UPI001E399528|nr:hypothetical protein [Nostoc mirabile]MCC5663296.1 hypothetical protein [Nostoc mirabile CHAB5784]
MTMKRGDRRDSNHSNAVNNPRSTQKEPASSHELELSLMTVPTNIDETASQRDEWKEHEKEYQEAASQLVHVQQEIQTYQIEANKLKKCISQNYRFYIDEKNNHQDTLYFYTKYELVNSEREMYLSLYNKAQAKLKHEQHSKASIKGWETRRKADNEQLKWEIAQMVVLLRESLESKDKAVNSLYVVAERMDRIQSLVDSLEEETTNNPIGLVQKFKSIWLVIKDIFSE